MDDNQLRQRRTRESPSPSPPRRAPHTEHSRPTCARVAGTLLKLLVLGAALSAALSYIVTQTLTWTYPVPAWQKLFPPEQRNFTVAELGRYDGSNASLPIYLAIRGHVFDVTAGRNFYGPGGGYHFFAGRDASRAFITGCFNDPSHLTHDLRGLADKELGALDGWLAFYQNSQKYFQVGRVLLPTVDPSSPVPTPCRGQSKPS